MTPCKQHGVATQNMVIFVIINITTAAISIAVTTTTTQFEILSSRLVSKDLKIKIYKSIILRVFVSMNLSVSW
jgi:hypothetical protein